MFLCLVAELLLTLSSLLSLPLSFWLAQMRGLGKTYRRFHPLHVLIAILRESVSNVSVSSYTPRKEVEPENHVRHKTLQMFHRFLEKC